MIKEFKEFALKGNMVDMAVGIIIGAAFGTVVSSLVADIFLPIIGALFAVDYSNWFYVLAGEGTYNTVAAAREAGAVTLNIGLFINAVISFLIVAFALFLLIKGMNRVKRLQAEEEKENEKADEPPRSEVLLEEIRDLLAKT